MKLNNKPLQKLLHYAGKAIADFNMIEFGDRVLVCVSGGKDSFALLNVLRFLRMKTNNRFDLFALIVDQGLPHFDKAPLEKWLNGIDIPYHIEYQDTYSIVKAKVTEGKSYCSFCARLRRGIIYRYAKEHGFTKIALGHHRDDLIASLLMSMFYSGEIRSMPPKLLTNDKKHIVIRPFCYCQEKDIIAYLKGEDFKAGTCNGCGVKRELMRHRVRRLIDQLASENPKVPSNLLHALQNVRPSQLMDQNLWDFKGLKDT